MYTDEFATNVELSSETKSNTIHYLLDEYLPSQISTHLYSILHKRLTRELGTKPTVKKSSEHLFSRKNNIDINTCYLIRRYVLKIS